MTASSRPTRRLVIGTVCAVLDHVAAVFPRNVHSLPARIDGPRAAAVIDAMTEVLRDLEDFGIADAWSTLVEGGYTDNTWKERL